FSHVLQISDYHLFRAMQNNLKGKEFHSFEILKTFVGNFDKKSTQFYDRKIRMLLKRWIKVNENEGDYVTD
ncbi:hypothetical protein X777_01851, partial [Ooceraea biroi]